MKHAECPGTLLARSRRGVLSPADVAALEAHLRTCECCRLSRQVMLDFDKDTLSERDDGARIQRLAAFVRQRVAEQSAPHSPLQTASHGTVPPVVAPERSNAAPTLDRLADPVPPYGFWAGLRARFPRGGTSAGQRHARTLLAAAAVFLVVAGASGAILVQRVVRDQPDATQRAALLTDALGAPVAHRARQIAKVAAPPLDQEKLAAVLGELEFSLGDDLTATQRTPCRGAGCEGSTASSLFKHANRARREGRTAEAIDSYRQLQRSHRSSPEAQLSHLSLGHLLLASGNPAQALSQFDSALDSSGASSVKAEALYGKGLALGRLGRSGEERSTWQRLLNEFGASPYAAHAKRRLSLAP